MATPSLPLGQIGNAAVGPIETTLMALIMASIVALVYVGYASSDMFRRREARSIAEHEKPVDFKR